MKKQRSIIMADNTYFSAAADIVIRHENQKCPKRRFSTFDLSNVSCDNGSIVAVATDFLAKFCPDLLEILARNDDRDRLIKIGRTVNSSLRYCEEVSSRETEGVSPPRSNGTEGEEIGNEVEADGALRRLVKECQMLAKILTKPTKVPTTRFGRTEIDMPIVNVGCMRFQQSWNRGGGVPVKSADQLAKDCQSNVVDILKHAINCGVTHIETAQMYGCSELQIGLALKQLFDEGFCRRDDLIIQTKGAVGSGTTKTSYKSSILEQLHGLGLEYVDLFAVHGLNTQDTYDLLFEQGEGNNLIEALQELRAEGRVKNVGFSTHGPAHVIKKAIETDSFDYVNLHYHFMGGGYTSAGDGDHTFEGNQENVRLARERDMGLFIISPFDKGGRLYAPSHLLRHLTLPQMEPLEYGCMWLWHHHDHAGFGRVHTIGVGAARPSDLDQAVIAAISSETQESKQSFGVVRKRIEERKRQILGEKWTKNWHLGLPNYSQCVFGGFQIGNIVWLFNCVQVYGVLDFAKERYATLLLNASNWDVKKTWKENVFSSPAFAWMPGTCYDENHDYSEELKDVPEENKLRVLEAMKFVHQWCSPENHRSNFEEKKQEDIDVPLEWQQAYDMRPNVAWPERS